MTSEAPKDQDKLDEVLAGIELIKKHLGIVPDTFPVIQDVFGVLEGYGRHVLQDGGLTPGTGRVRVATITEFLEDSNGAVNPDSVRAFLAKQTTPAMKNHVLRALRPFCRDYLRAGKWIEDFGFEALAQKVRTDPLPPKRVLRAIGRELEGEARLAYVLAYCTGLRIAELLSLQARQIVVQHRAIDVREAHAGKTKHALVSFYTTEAADLVEKLTRGKEGSDRLFGLTYSKFQKILSRACFMHGAKLTIKDFRLNFNDVCERHGIEGKYIEAFQGRVRADSKDVRKMHYTSYNFEKMQQLYWKLEVDLTLGL